MTLAIAAAVLALAVAAGFVIGFAYHHQPSSPAASSHRTTTACTHKAITTALIAANPQLNSFSWTLKSYACGSGWAIATVDAPSVGGGLAFLRQTASGWSGDPLSEAVYKCSDIRGSLGAAVPPQALAVALLNKVGICRT